MVGLMVFFGIGANFRTICEVVCIFETSIPEKLFNNTA